VVDAVSRPTHGLRDWLLQRLTAVYLAGFLIYLMVHFYTQPQVNYQEWQSWITHPAMTVASALFVLAVLLHGWVGMRDVVLDYIHSLHLRLLVLSLIALLFLGCGLWALQILMQAAG
jgi:succinate dehydrogenase / fumarate reductase membrane anchor subunit